MGHRPKFTEIMLYDILILTCHKNMGERAPPVFLLSKVVGTALDEWSGSVDSDEFDNSFDEVNS
jgi:hypothetical protein